MMNFSTAERSYDRMLAAGPPEPDLADVTVNYEVYVQEEQLLATLTEALGGEIHWAESASDDSFRLAKGSTVIEDVESGEEAEQITRNLMDEHLRHVINLDNAIIDAEEIDDGEPDWDAINKDRRLEREEGW